MKQEVQESGTVPTLEELKGELERENYKKRYYGVLRSTVYTLLQSPSAFSAT